MEATHGLRLFERKHKLPTLTEAGRLLLVRARQIVQQAELFEATARQIASGLEPELTIAVDAIVPTSPLIDSLGRLQARFPNLAVTLHTESIGGGARRLFSGQSALAICALYPTLAPELQAHPLTKVALWPVAAPGTLVASESRPLDRSVLSEYVQLILTDPIDPDGPSHSIVGSRVWRFVDLSRRLDFLLAGFGWGNMPQHLVHPLVETGKLVRLKVRDTSVISDAIPLYLVHRRDQPLGVAARSLFEDLQTHDWYY
jgi:DNA-binding transcriptional LysR family regulator